MKGLICGLCFVILLPACKEESFEDERPYPVVVTTASGISGDGCISLGGVIENPKNLNITEYGVEYYISGMPASDRARVNAEGQPDSEKFDFSICGGLLDRWYYVYRPYIRSEGFTIYGEEKSFRAENIPDPVIESLSASEGTPGQIIALKGSSFGYLKHHYNIYFDWSGQEPLEVSDSVIRFRVPGIIYKKTYDIYLGLGTRKIPVNQTFTIR